MLPINAGTTKAFYAYRTSERIIGVGSFPLDGNPSQCMGLVAHPGIITDLCLSYDGRYLFSTGGADLTTNMWSVDLNPLSSALDSMTPEKEMNSYLELLEGGKGGELHSDIVDYFYLCQLRTQGEDAMGNRAINGYLSVVQ